METGKFPRTSITAHFSSELPQFLYYQPQASLLLKKMQCLLFEFFYKKINWHPEIYSAMTTEVPDDGL